MQKSNHRITIIQSITTIRILTYKIIMIKKGKRIKAGSEEQVSTVGIIKKLST